MRAQGIHWAAKPTAISASAGERRRYAITDTKTKAAMPSHQMTRFPES